MPDKRIRFFIAQTPLGFARISARGGRRRRSAQQFTIILFELRSIEERGTEPRIPPRRDAKLQKKKTTSPVRRAALDKRDDATRRIHDARKTKTKGALSEARKLWRQEGG